MKNLQYEKNKKEFKRFLRENKKYDGGDFKESTIRSYCWRIYDLFEIVNINLKEIEKINSISEGNKWCADAEKLFDQKESNWRIDPKKRYTIPWEHYKIFARGYKNN